MITCQIYMDTSRSDSGTIIVLNTEKIEVYHLIQPILLVPECYFALYVELKVLKLKSFFSRMYFLSVASFFQVMVICLS